MLADVERHAEHGKNRRRWRAILSEALDVIGRISVWHWHQHHPQTQQRPRHGRVPPLRSTLLRRLFTSTTRSSPSCAAESSFGELLNARKASVRIWAEGAPFENKDTLRARGYRWSDGSNGLRRAWWTDVEEDAVDAEVSYLRTAIFANQPVEFPMKEDHRTGPLFGTGLASDTTDCDMVPYSWLRTLRCSLSLTRNGTIGMSASYQSGHRKVTSAFGREADSPVLEVGRKKMTLAA